MPDTQTRAEAVEEAIHTHQGYKRGDASCPEEDVIDLLADLRHYCDREGLCLGDLDRMAHQHYLAERFGPGQEEGADHG